MDNILPVEPYLRQVRTPWGLTIAAGAALGTLFQASRFLAPETLAREAPNSGPLEILAWGFCGGIAAAIFFMFCLNLRLRLLVRRTYDATSILEAPPPEDPAFTHRLIATSDHPSVWGRVAGALYAGKGRLVFVPQRANLQKNRQPREIPVDSRTRFTTGTFTPKVPAWFGARPLTTLIVVNGAASETFQVPEAETAAQALREIVLG